MNRNEQEYYANINSIANALDRIANALENQNQFVVNTVKGQKAKAEEGDKIYYKTRKDMFMDNPCTKEEYEASKDIPGFEGTLDALDDLCNIGTNPKNDPERDKFKNDLSIRYKNKIKEFPKVDSDDDLRKTARMYSGELQHGHFSTKKECILDYVTNEFGSHGARYTDIIKFAYYLNNPNSPKFGYENRGYYACAMTHNRWGFGHLISGGKDFFVKGINKEGNERYFAHSFVESVTDYWKFCDNTK